MKYFYQFARIFTGALFIFSGMVKLNDPSGFAIKLNEYFDVFAQDVSVKQDSLSIHCFVNNQKLINQKFALYAFDSKKKLEWHINPTENDNPPPSVLFEVFGMYGPNSFTSNVYEPTPLTSTRMLVKAGDVIVYDKSEKLDSNNTGIHDYNVELILDQYIKPESNLNAFFKGLKTYSLLLSILFCALEVILGFSMLISYRMSLTLSVTAFLVVFFTFLTGYSAYFNKVTDCGCFGDFLKLKPWDSFKKDIVLDALVLFMFIGVKQFKPLISPSKNNKIMFGFSLLTLLFGIYCYYYLPIWDFLPYKKGNDIKKIMTEVPKGMRATDSIAIKFVLQKGTDSVKVTSRDYASYAQKGYNFVRQDRQVIEEGYKSPIHDFSITNQLLGIDYKDTMLNSTDLQLLFIVPFLENARAESIQEFKKIADWLINIKKGSGIKLYALTSASDGPAADFAKKYQLPFQFYSADQKMLMTMARYNPTLYLFDGSVVLNKWSGRNLPDIQELEAYLSEKSNHKK